MNFPSSWRLAMPAALVCSFTGCHVHFDDIDSGHFQEAFHQSLAISPGGRLNLDNENGSVEISVWDRNEVDINATKYASSEALLKEVRIEAAASQGDVTIHTIRGHTMTHGNSGVRYTIRVPKRINLARIHSTNGPITVDGTEGPAVVESTNGALRFNHMAGSIEGTTTNGAIEVEQCKGDVRFHSTNGKIEGDTSGGAIDARTSNGSILLRASALAGKPPVHLGTSNGHIELTLDEAHETHASTSNATITIHLPGSANADIRARTSHSKVTTEFSSSMDDAEMEGGGDKRHDLNQRLGKGGPVIELTTSNGSIHIAKG